MGYYTMYTLSHFIVSHGYFKNQQYIYEEVIWVLLIK